MKYQIVLTSVPPQIVTNPLTFKEANDLACLLQADVQANEKEKIPVNECEFFVVEPIISESIKSVWRYSNDL